MLETAEKIKAWLLQNGYTVTERPHGNKTGIRVSMGDINFNVRKEDRFEGYKEVVRMIREVNNRRRKGRL